MDRIPHRNDKKVLKPKKHRKHHSASPHHLRYGSDAVPHVKRSGSLPAQFSRGKHPSEYRHVTSPQQLFSYVDNQIAHFAQYHNQSRSEMMRQYFPEQELESYEMLKRQVEAQALAATDLNAKSKKKAASQSDAKQKQNEGSQLKNFINPPKREPPSNKEVEELDISMQFGGLTDEDLSTMYKRWINIRRKSLNTKQRKEICIFLKRIRFELEARSAMLRRTSPEESRQPEGPGPKEDGDLEDKNPTAQNPSLQNSSHSPDIKQQDSAVETPQNNRLPTVLQSPRRLRRSKVICEIEVHV